MKHRFLSPTAGTNGPARFVWASCIILVWAAALCILLGVPSRATGHLSADLPDAPYPTSDDARVTAPKSLLEATGSGAPGVLGATQTLTHTVYLPWVVRDDWEAPDSLLGVQLFQSFQQEEAVKADQMGTRWVRLPIKWASIEPVNLTPENYTWRSNFDDWLAQLSARNIQVILTLSKNPPWAATYAGGPIDLAGVGELVEFLTAAVARYGAPPYNVKHWEIYNEPDNGIEFYGQFGWGYWGHDPEAYAQLLAAIYQPMKDADPEAQIVFGGLAYDNWTSQGGPFVEEFLDEVLKNNGGDYFDVMNFHYYPTFRANWEAYGPGIIGKATYLRDKLRSYGVDKPFICSEASMWSDELHGGSHELQSRYVPQLFTRSMAANLETTIWFQLLDDEEPDSWKYGLLNADLSPKPAYSAYQTLARQLAPADYVRTHSAQDTGSDQIEAYEFVTADGSTVIIVAWTEDQQEHLMTLTAEEVAVVDKFGNETTIYGETAGGSGSRVQVIIGPDPVYLRLSN
jgi:hypothetical protein